MRGNFLSALKAVTICALLIWNLFSGAGCSDRAAQSDQYPEEHSVYGLIYEIEGSAVLVVEGIESAAITREEWFETGKRAVYFRVTEQTEIEYDGKVVSFDILTRGDRVQAWPEGGIAESYPEQAAAARIVILEKTED